MSVYSMTGFAHATHGAAGSTDEPAARGAAAGSAVSVEVRSVNSRFLDLAFRLPDELRGLEPALRDLVGAAFKRGKIELRVATQREADGAWPQPQPDQLNKLSRLESTVTSWLPNARPLSVNEALHWCRQGGATERLDEAALAAARTAIDGLREARAREGARLVTILMERIARLRELAVQAAPLVPAVVQRQQQRFLERWNEALSATTTGFERLLRAARVITAMANDRIPVEDAWSDFRSAIARSIAANSSRAVPQCIRSCKS